VRLNGQTLAVAPGIELGHPVVTVGLGIPSQRSGRLEYAWTAPRAWHEEGGMIVYRLTVQGEPTIVPTRLELAVAIPENAHVARVSPGMHVGRDRITWTGEPGDLTTFEVAFRRPFPAGILGHLS